MHDVFAYSLAAVGKAHAIAANVKQCAGINLLACQPAFD
jgi:hypothetical protein